MLLSADSQRDFMKKYFIAISFLALAFFAMPRPSFADVSCYPIYGGGQTCFTTSNILINKSVQNPKTGQFVDNLGINDIRYSPDQTVTFQIAVQNTGNSKIDRAIVTDTLPSYVSFKSGPGNFDSNSKTLTFEVDNLAVSETRTFTVQAIVNHLNQLPQNQITCVVNQASAQIVQTGQESTDNSQFCIQTSTPVTTKGGLPVYSAPTMTTTPGTGPEMVVLPLLSGSGALGWFLRKKTIK